MDLSMTYTISTDEKWQTFVRGFLRDCPIPTDDHGDPTMTVVEWVHLCGKRFFLKRCHRGLKSLKSDEAVIEMDLIE